jgi:hypothetical protein
MSDRFGTLRALLQQAPSEAVWGELCEELALWGEEERDAVALPYVLGHLDKWPDAVERRANSSQAVWRQRLANSLDLYDAESVRAVVERGDGARLVALHLTQTHDALCAELERFARLERVKVELFDGREVEALMEARWPTSLRALELALYDEAPDVWGRRIAAAIAQNETLAGLAVLRLGGAVVGDAGAQALAASSHLRALRELDLSDCKIGPSGARALAASSILDGVTRLNLDSNGPGMGLAALIGSPHTRALRSLNIKGAALSAPCARALAALAWPPELEELELNLGGMSERAQAALAGVAALRAVRSVCSADTGDPARMSGFLASPHLTGLRELTIIGAHDEATWEAVCGNSALAGLEKLYIVETSLTPAQIEALARSPLRASLRRLYADSVAGDLVALFERAEWPALRELRLYGDHRSSGDESFTPLFDDAAVVRLVASGVVRGLEVLALPFNLLSDVVALALADSGKLGGLRELELGSNQISDAGLVALIARGGLESLEVLGLANNLIGDVGAAALAHSPLLRALKRDHPGHFVAGGLNYNRIGGAGVQALLRSPHIDALHELDLYGNSPLTHEDIVAMAALPGIARLNSLWSSIADHTREETWQTLLDSPYTNPSTRQIATQRLSALRSPQT